MAGEDVTYAEDVIYEACGLLAARHNRFLTDAAIAMTKGYQTVRRRQIEDLYLGSYGIDMADFLSKGANYPTAAKRQSLLDQIDEYDLECEFLVAGFGPGINVPEIFQICNPGRYLPQGLLGYWAIGSGKVNAISYLARRNQNARLGFETSLYNAIAAKKLAERADGVGSPTSVYVIEASKPDVRWIKQPQLRAIVDIWNKEEAFIRPVNLKDRIKEIVPEPEQLPTLSETTPSSAELTPKPTQELSTPGKAESALETQNQDPWNLNSPFSTGAKLST